MAGPDKAEGDVNSSPRRSNWRAGLSQATREALDADAAAFFHQALSTPCLDVVEAADGAWLITRDGRRLLDFHGNAVHQVGYGHPHVVQAIHKQLAELPFCPRRFTHDGAIRLASRLIDYAPARLGKVLFAPSGAAAIGMALKLARYATGRHKTLSMWDAFHGANLDAISVGGEAIFRQNVGPLLPGAEHVPPPVLAKRFFGGDDRSLARLADYIDYVLEVQGDVAALVAEPMRWTTVEPPVPSFWAAVRQSCDRQGTLLIFDEIPACMARSGTVFLSEQAGCAPDILCIGKGLGGGVVPMAAMLGRADLDVAGDYALGHYTHEKSTLGCAAANAVLDVIEDEGLCERSRELGAHMAKRLNALQARTQLNCEVRGLGLYYGLELRREDGTPANDEADALLYACLERGLSFKVGGGNVISLCPPLTIAERELDQALDILEAALVSVVS
ncbi:MAG: aspartate aminotransferase family protein [Geminicoccaceae bacterium]